ncbi:hypothetical protein Ga0074812_105283 [Parafrankia irregularis]|uniref:Uncharacterized protein n=1 Tax=Parafrankia irregularis TaxID=795642 RepID=A0A0S4QKM6_9ACTN|nr:MULTISPECIES: hypothetical protein [Frankiaceae]EFC81191.1 hypothetical protein FrEUN1fDRAFT_5674 [Parafrankia sp. EUN1f]CUU55631.1 hypothetical protein Ga0074812_105283 [Parafrankia irregularis]
MPKNYGAGVAGGAARVGGLRSFVRLGRRELWVRLDRNMIAGARKEPAGRPSAGPSSPAELAPGS